ncbi:polysaccharide biosynthesis C-terminal domain-containing protein [Pseudooceanicola sp. HF7]|uniref:MATE family efflux transporter n=1 Tax=Pseudooceanicola sp. HF7 TaxID=2721560 RepID=UPI001431593B|nr:polysaccharide biosynthesis C-terminal domain-containing protein [Pseudooceanicola sp. HF7]NIZ10951.1 hypothetical protein [Pseudooceanicola sp. HF7]
MSVLRAKLRGQFLRAFAGSMAVAIPARFAQLGMAVLLARRFGPEGYGLFTYALGLGLLAGRLGGLGWPTLVTRFIPSYVAGQDWNGLKGLLRAAYPVAITAALICSVLLVALAYGLGPEHKLFTGLVLGAILIPMMSLRSLVRNMLAGYRRPSVGIAVDELLPPLLICLLVVVLNIQSASTAVYAYAISSLIAVGYGLFCMKGSHPAELAQAAPHYRMRLWMGIALPALVGMSAKLIMNRTDVIMIAPLSTLEEVSLYGVALRVTFVQTFPLVVLSTVLSPQISSYISSGRMKKAEQLFYGSLLFAFLLPGGITIGLIGFSEQIMFWIFGNDYVTAAPTLRILAIAQISACMGIPSTSFMLMNGYQKSFGVMTIIALVLNIGGNYLLIPHLGSAGASWATLTSATLLAIMQICACIRIIRRNRHHSTGAAA